MRDLLSGFPTEKIRLHKKSGSIIENIEALVQPKTIFVDDPSVLIEEEDVFERNLPNGLIEQYLVLDRGFHKGMRGIPDHYQVSVRKMTSIPRQTSGTTYNIKNDGGRVNINSTDNSINISLTKNDEKLFETLIQLANDLSNKDLVIEAIKEMKQEAGKPTFAAKYNNFIQMIANHITIFAPFIPALTAFLSK